VSFCVSSRGGCICIFMLACLTFSKTYMELGV
jgi:hypothetical protein